MVSVPLGPAPGPPPELELDAQAAASRLTAMTTPSLIRRLIALALRLVLCARQGGPRLGFPRWRRTAGRAGFRPSSADVCRRSCQNRPEHLETYPGRDLRHVCPVTFAILAFLVSSWNSLTVGSI